MAAVKKTVPGMAETIAQRMEELGLSPTGLKTATGLSLQGLAPLRNGVRRHYQDRLKFPVCAALQWTPDSIDRLLRGDPPVALAGPTSAIRGVTIADLAATVEEIRVMVEGIASRLVEVDHRLVVVERRADPPAPAKQAPRRRPAPAPRVL